MCNLYSMTKNQAAIRNLFKVDTDSVGNLPSMPGIFPDYPAPIVRNVDGGRELTMARWGMPSSSKALMDATAKRAAKLDAKGKQFDFKELLRMEPDSGTTNIRTLQANTGSGGSASKTDASSRCRRSASSTRRPVGTFGSRWTRAGRWFCFAGMWTNWTSVRKVREGETTNDIYAFLDDESQRRGRDDPPEGHAGDPDDCRRGRRLDERAMGRGERPAAAASGRRAADRRPRRQEGWRRGRNMISPSGDGARQNCSGSGPVGPSQARRGEGVTCLRHMWRC
jgi:putative SOS response-associated peptidase YedK